MDVTETILQTEPLPLVLFPSHIAKLVKYFKPAKFSVKKVQKILIYIIIYNTHTTPGITA